MNNTQNSCPNGFVYTINQGDTFYKIARRYEISVQDLIDANPNIDPANLQVGQQICVPTDGIPEVCILKLNPRTEGPTPNASGILWIRRQNNSVQLIVMAVGLPDPTELEEEKYTATFTWGRTTFDLPLFQIESEVVGDIWLGIAGDSFPPEFFSGSIDIYPGPVLGGLISNCQ